MTRLEAHARFAMMHDRAFIGDAEFQRDPHFPAIATAFAECAGWLDDATTDDELREAAAHGESLYATGVLEGDEIADVSNEIILDVMRWCEAQGATCSQDS